MSVPAKRLSRSKGRRRRSQQGKSDLHLGKCLNCSNAVRPHRVCPNCGFYKGKEIIKISLPKKENKAKS
jgi:large subunit ribosomal protein L32